MCDLFYNRYLWGLVFRLNQDLQLDPVKAASASLLWLSTQPYNIQQELLGAADSWKPDLNCGRIWKKNQFLGEKYKRLSNLHRSWWELLLCRARDPDHEWQSSKCTLIPFLWTSQQQHISVCPCVAAGRTTWNVSIFLVYHCFYRQGQNRLYFSALSAGKSSRCISKVIDLFIMFFLVSVSLTTPIS